MNHLEMAKWHMEKELGDLSEMNIEAGRTYALIAIAEQLVELNKSDTHKAIDSASELFRQNQPAA